ncbi:hypothetical protein V2J09_009619 [Rumex salicifolius]
MASFEAFKLTLLIFSLIALSIPVNSLNFGIQSADTGVQVSKECSRTCESQFCSLPPLLKYGKYCGVLYSGCPGERPCDGLDACCMKHDECVQATGGDYISQDCSQRLLNCMESFQRSGGRTFKGSTCQADDVIEVIKLVMEAALIAGRADAIDQLQEMYLLDDTTAIHLQAQRQDLTLHLAETKAASQQQKQKKTHPAQTT